MTEDQFRKFWQDRCQVYDPGCIFCRGWQMRDLLAAVVREQDEVATGTPTRAVEAARTFLTAADPVTWPVQEYNPWGSPEV